MFYTSFLCLFCLADKPKDTEPVKAPQSPPPRRSHVHPLDQHKLLYILHYDSQLTLYAFTTLQTILMHSPHQFVCASSTTSISSSNTPHQEKIKELLIRHRRSLLGKGFYGALYESPVSPSGTRQSPWNVLFDSLLLELNLISENAPFSLFAEQS